MTDREIEKEIQNKGLIAPRITPADIDENIISEFYFTGADGVAGHFSLRNTKDASVASVALEVAANNVPSTLRLLTFCVLVLKNGFTVTGESACASPENFDAEIGRKIARANAINKVWPLMGYALKERLVTG